MSLEMCYTGQIWKKGITDFITKKKKTDFRINL